MNKLIKTNFINSLLLLSAICIPQSSAMESANDIIEGSLTIVPKNPLYAAGFSKTIMDQLKLKADDVMVEVWVKSDESSDWASHGHPRLEKNQQFPNHLPYSLLKGKKEGKSVYLQMYGKSFKLNLRQFRLLLCELWFI